MIRVNLKEQTANILRTLNPPIRQIEVKALRKLRHPSRSRRLRAFIDRKAFEDGRD